MNIAINKKTVLSVFAAVALIAGVVIAAPPTSMYNPGETTDPTCAPGDTNCDVKIRGKFVDGINPADAVYTEGNVGIGTTVPSRKLHIYDSDGAVAGAGYFYQEFTDQDTVDSVGVYSYATNNANSTNSRAAFGLIAYGRANPNTGVTLPVVHTGVYGEATNIGSGIAESLMGVRGSVGNSGSGTITNGYALHATCRDAITCYGLYVSAGDADVTTDWGVFVTAEDKNYFSGNVGIGTTDPQSKLSVLGLQQGTDDSVTPGNLVGALCITNLGNIYIDTDGTCAN